MAATAPSQKRKASAKSAFAAAKASSPSRRTPRASALENRLTQPKVPDIPSPVGAPMPISATPAAGADRSILVTRYNRWRERYNPLRGLTIAKAVTLLESYQRGEMADPQWTYFFIEQSDPDLFAILERREAALLELDWNIKMVSGRWPKEDPRQKKFDAGLAGEQSAALREAYERIDNLYEAVSHLQLATFRGYSHCEKYRDPAGEVYHLEIVDQWNMVRDLLRGRWKYNPAAIQTTFYNLPADLLVEPADFVIRERDRHVNRIGLIKFIRANLCDKDWDAFIEIYAIPSGVVIGPPNVPSGREADYEAAAKQIAEGGSGYLPHQSDYKPNDQPRGTSPFRPRLDYLSEKLVLAGTGGLLTMLAQSGSGTLAGNAHMEAFQSIARAEARKISELFQKQFDAEVLSSNFRGKDPLVYFEIAANDEMDPAVVTKQALELRQAGFKIDAEQLSERTGYTLIDSPLPPKIDVRSQQDNPQELETDDKIAALQNRADAIPATSAAIALVLDRLYAVASADESEFSEKLMQFIRDLPDLAKQVIAEPHAAKAFEGALGAALAQGMMMAPKAKSPRKKGKSK
jgi:phage gp29-like protein